MWVWGASALPLGPSFSLSLSILCHAYGCSVVCMSGHYSHAVVPEARRGLCLLSYILVPLAASVFHKTDPTPNPREGTSSLGSNCKVIESKTRKCKVRYGGSSTWEPRRRNATSTMQSKKLGLQHDTLSPKEKELERQRRLPQQLRALVAPVEDPVQFPAPVWWFLATHNPVPVAYTPGTHTVQILACR